MGKISLPPIIILARTTQRYEQDSALPAETKAAQTNEASSSGALDREITGVGLRDHSVTTETVTKPKNK